MSCAASRYCEDFLEIAFGTIGPGSQGVLHAPRCLPEVSGDPITTV